MSRTVYILGDGGHDYSDAKRFGDIHMIDIPPSVKYNTAQIYDILREELDGAKEDDLIVISHLASVIGIATGFMVEWYGRVNYLFFSQGKYEERTVIYNHNL